VVGIISVSGCNKEKRERERNAGSGRWPVRVGRQVNFLLVVYERGC